MAVVRRAARAAVGGSGGERTGSREEVATAARREGCDGGESMGSRARSPWLRHGLEFRALGRHGDSGSAVDDHGAGAAAARVWRAGAGAGEKGWNGGDWGMRG